MMGVKRGVRAPSLADRIRLELLLVKIWRLGATLERPSPWSLALRGDLGESWRWGMLDAWIVRGRGRADFGVW
jgi:hypothetical protein